jgi:tetratricopeptide (TPR) repeat protein
MSALRLLLNSTLSILAFAGAASSAAAQSPAVKLLDSARTMIAQATPSGDVAAMTAAYAMLERASAASPDDPWILHYQAFALYREATTRMGRDKADVRPMLERIDSLLERSAKLKPIPETHALRAAVIGMMIGSNPLRGMMLGPRSNSQMERAMSLGPTNPRVWLLRGIGAFNTPAMFGGGADKAEEYLRKAIELFANDHPQAPAPDWGLGEAHVWLGQAYAKQAKVDSARASYERALAIEPGDYWVRMVLLPALDRKKQ